MFALRNKLQEQIENIEEEIIGREEQIRAIEKKSNMISLESARLKAEISVLKEEIEQYGEVEILKETDQTTIKRKISTFESQLAGIGAVNMKALEIYDNVQEQYNVLIEKRDKLISEKETIFEMMNEIETRKKELFLKVFEMVNT